MVKACILIKAVPTKVEKITEALKEIKGTRKVFYVYGRVDLVVFMEATNNKQVADITGKVNSIEGVRSTETLIEA